MPRHSRPDRHRFQPTEDPTPPRECIVCGGTVLDPLHAQLHPFNPADLASDDGRAVPEYCRCGLPAKHPNHADPRPFHD